jgi:Pentapeptide repeats (9 copies)
MSDETEEPQAGESKSPKIKAEDNPWYLLATLHGEPQSMSDPLLNQNRVVWNRYFAANLNEQMRARLVEEKQYTIEELTPLSNRELKEISESFSKRHQHDLPPSGDIVDFSNVHFDKSVFFDRYLFPNLDAFSYDCTFRGASFCSRANFSEATFLGSADFQVEIFSGDAYFLGAYFAGTANFKGVTFLHGTTLSYVTFAQGAFFDCATFGQLADFHGATFHGSVSFSGTTAFADFANFAGTTLSGGAKFTDATFRKGATFANAKVKFVTSFAGATFETAPPTFYGAELHQGTVWRGIKWPEKPKDKYEAGFFIDAYACLKLEMDRLKRHEDELDFFALELQSRQVLLGPVHGLPIVLYGFLSGYGRSYARPLVALFVVAAIGLAAFWYFDARTFGEAVGLSAANTLNVFGFRRDFDLAIDTPLAWLKILAAFQTILGTILLFLIGLGIRNKFRMK